MGTLSKFPLARLLANASNGFAALSMALLIVFVSGCSDKADTGVDTADIAGLSYTVEPPEAGVGTELSVSIIANSSHFSFGASEVDFGEGITVNSVMVEDGWTLSANISIDAEAETGLRDLTVHVNGSNEPIIDGFRVVNSSLEISPSNGMIGETVEVSITGTNTQWLAGRTWVGFGDAIDVLEFTVISETQAEAKIAIRSDAAPGLRDVYTEDGQKVVTLHDGFQVDRVGLAAEFDPTEAKQGRTVEFSVYGRGTDFRSGQMTIDFYDGGDLNGDVVVDQITVLDSENLWGRMTLSNAAALGDRDVLVTVDRGLGDEEGVMITDAFEVTGGDLDLEDVRVSMSFTVTRGTDNQSGDLSESVRASVVFWIPLDPPCGGGGGSMASGPQPYDVNGVFPTPPEEEGGTEDCPNPQTVSAGDYVWLESSANVVTLEKIIDHASGMISYQGRNLTMADYVAGQWYDLHLQGDENGLPEEIVDRVQPTVPCNWYLTSPDLWGNYTHNRAEPFDYTWGDPAGGTVGACSYPDAIFTTSIPGTIEATGESGFAGSLPWDDGVHSYTPAELTQLAPNPTYFTAYSYMEGPEFGLRESKHQDNVAPTYIYYQASLVLE